jgi:hypothetical protein
MPQLQLKYGGEPPMNRWSRYYRWNTFRKAFSNLEIPEGEYMSDWMRIEGLPDRQWLKRAIAMISNEAKSLGPKEWAHHTVPEKMEDGTFTLWIVKVNSAGMIRVTDSPRLTKRRRVNEQETILNK